MTEFFINIENKQLTSERLLRSHMEQLEDGRYKVTIQKGKKRSLPINAYYWACVITMQQKEFKNIGYDYSKEDVHEFNKAEFNYTEVINHDTGEVKRVPRSTKKLSNTEFMEFLDRIKIFCAEWFHLSIPDPGQQTEFFQS